MSRERRSPARGAGGDDDRAVGMLLRFLSNAVHRRVAQLAVRRAVRIHCPAVAHDEVERRGLRALVGLDVLDRFPDVLDDVAVLSVDEIEKPMGQLLRVRLPLDAVSILFRHELMELFLGMYRAVMCEDAFAVEKGWVFSGVLGMPPDLRRCAMMMLGSALMQVVMNCGSSNAAAGDFSTCGRPSKNQPKPQPSGCCLDRSRNWRMRPAAQASGIVPLLERRGGTWYRMAMKR